MVGLVHHSVLTSEVVRELDLETMSAVETVQLKVPNSVLCSEQHLEVDSAHHSELTSEVEMEPDLETT